MLAAARKEDPLDMTNIDQSASPSRKFDSMFTSLQGLQQRLENFSTADVADAEVNAQTLIYQLGECQKKIAVVACLKKVSADVSKSLAALPQVNTEAISLDSLENHPTLHAIIKASKLIKLHRVMAALKAGTTANGTSTNRSGESTKEALYATDQLPPEESSAVPWKSASEPEPREVSTAIEASATRVVPSITTDNESISESLLDSFVPKPATESDQGATELTTLTKLPTAQVEFETAIASGSVANSPTAKAHSEDSPPLETLGSVLEETIGLAVPTGKPSSSVSPRSHQKLRERSLHRKTTNRERLNNSIWMN